MDDNSSEPPELSNKSQCDRDISEAKPVTGLPESMIKFEESYEEEYPSRIFTKGPYAGFPWVSRSDFLIGTVGLTPPFTQKHKQALTHQGILELGGDVESKLLNDFKTEREKAVSEREDYLTRLFEARKTDLIQNFHRDEELRIGTQLDEVRLFYENKICEHLWECFEQVKILQEHMQIEFESLNNIWAECLQREIEDTVKKITEEFLQKLQIQEQILVSMYTKQIKTLKKKKKAAIEFEKKKCKEMVLQMKHKLHCENMSNLMYLLCKERRTCKAEKKKIGDKYLAQMNKIRKTIGQKSDTIRKLTNVKNKKTKELCLKERCLVEVLRQFQKFIYLALETAPTQGSFLMNVYKLVTYELDDYCPRTNIPKLVRKKSGKRTKIGDVRYDPDIEEFLKYSNYPIDDGEAEYTWPVFYFNKKKFVREDFDVFSKGVDKSSQHSLWHPEVEELLNIFKKAIKAKQNAFELTKMKSYQSNVRFDHGERESEVGHEEGSVSDELQTFSPDSSFAPRLSPVSTSPIVPQLSQNSPQRSTIISLKKSPSLEDEEEEEIRKISLGETPDYKETKPSKVSIEVKLPKLSLRGSKFGSLPKAEDDFGPRQHMRLNSTTPSRLTLARDSVTLTISTMEKKSLQRLSRSSREKYLDQLTDAGTTQSEFEDDTFVDVRVHDFDVDISSPSVGSFEVTHPAKPTSKLVLACDSYEIIRSSMNLDTAKDKERASKTTEKSMSQLTFSPKVSVMSEDDRPQPLTIQRLEDTYETPPPEPEPLSLKKLFPPPKPAPPPKPRLARKAKIIGSRQMKEHVKTVNQFTNERIADLVLMMKKNPSVVPLFTPCPK